jgi:hypothetical protein
MEDDLDKQLDRNHRNEATRKRILSEFEELKEDTITRTTTSSTTTSEPLNR